MQLVFRPYKHLQDFVRQYPDVELVFKLKTIEKLALQMRQQKAAIEAQMAEEARAITVYKRNGSSEKLVESRRCQDKCTKAQELDAKNFSSECTASGFISYPGLCCDTVCSGPVGKLEELISQPGYLSLDEATTLQFFNRVHGLPQDQPKNLVIELEKIDIGDRVIKNYGRFYDEGKGGNLVAHGGAPTIRVDFKESKLGILRFRSRLLRPNGTWSLGKVYPIEVQPKNIFSTPRANGNKLKILHHSKHGDIVANNIIVTVRKGTRAARVKELATRVNCKIIDRKTLLDAWILETETDSVEAIDKALNALKQFPEITIAQPHHIAKLAN